MPRAKKDGKYVNCYVKRELVDRLEAYSEKTLIPKTSVIEVALEQYLDKIEIQDSHS